MNYFSFFTLLLIVGYSCKTIPKEKLNQYEHYHSYQFKGDELELELVNTLKCPMRIWVQSNDDQIKNHFDQVNPFTLGPLKDTLVKVKLKNIEVKEVHFASRYGDTSEIVAVRKVALPFQKGKSYSLIQGNNSTPTHHTNWSRYAFDFGLAKGDTICAATNGFVVGVIEDYKYGGAQEKWRDFANLITIYDPESALFTQYVHLDYKGSLVELGDSVSIGQHIGIAGMTGFTNIEHLHFNCLKPVHSQDGLISVPIDSIGDYKVSKLKRNQSIKNK